MIDVRPSEVYERIRKGHWEIDTVIRLGKKGKVLVTRVERVSRYCIIVVADDKTAISVCRVILQGALSMRKHFKTVTCDNGAEFALHEKLSEKLEEQWYFAHSYHSWERGSCENANGLIRQYFPKGMDFDKLTQKDAGRVMEKLNSRPRRHLRSKE